MRFRVLRQLGKQGRRLVDPWTGVLQDACLEFFWDGENRDAYSLQPRVLCKSVVGAGRTSMDAVPAKSLLLNMSQHGNVQDIVA